MLNWKDYYAQEQIRQERLREAKQQRLVTMLSRNIRDARKRAWTQILKSLGYRLVEWGDALVRYAGRRQMASQ
jgi:hypothetical protein